MEPLGRVLHSPACSVHLIMGILLALGCQAVHVNVSSLYCRESFPSAGQC